MMGKSGFQHSWVNSMNSDEFNIVITKSVLNDIFDVNITTPKEIKEFNISKHRGEYMIIRYDGGVHRCKSHSEYLFFKAFGNNFHESFNFNR